MKAVFKLVTAAAFATAFVLPSAVRADRDALPPDFELSPVTFGGAGGGMSRSESATLAYCPIVLIPDMFRDHNDWTGQNTGPFSTAHGDVYAALRRKGFQPIEIWMIDFAPAGHHMTSIEEATDDLKLFITAVMAYTGANRVQLVAHGTGGLLARLTLLKYNIAHWVAAEVYINTPFHGANSDTVSARTLAGDPNAWVSQPDSPLLREILVHGETPTYPDPLSGIPFRLPTLTIGNRDNPHLKPASSALRGALNRAFPDLDHDALRCSPKTVDAYADFLKRPTQPLRPEQDGDGDGFTGHQWGGPDVNDADADIYPGAPEIPGDGIDQDCNGCDKAAHGGREMEIPLQSR